MEPKDRLQEAIKQVDIVIEDTDESDPVRELKQGRETLERAQKLLAGLDD